MSLKTLSWKIQQNIANLNSDIKFKSLGSIKELSLDKDVVTLVGFNSQGEQILAVPGVVGGESTKAQSDSRELLIEIANFDPEQVARNSFKLNYRSDANKLFAGDINISLVKLATVKLMNLLPHNNNFDNIFKRISKNSSFVTSKVESRGIEINWEYLCSRFDNRFVEYWKPILESKLIFLGSYNKETNRLIPNVFYGKIETKEDLLEELIRLIGFENLEPDYINFSSNNQYNTFFDKEIAVKNLMTNLGYTEVITRPFVNEKMLINKENALKLLNPYSSLESFYRDNLETSLSKVYSENLSRGQKNIQIFEINEIYPEGNYKPNNVLAALIESEDPYHITTLAHSLKNYFNYTDTEYLESKINILDIGQQTIHSSITITQISNKLKKLLNIPLSKTLWTLTIDISNLNQINLLTIGKYTDITQYPSIKRAYSHQISSNLTWENVDKLIKNLVDGKCQVKINPIERFRLNEESDKLNFEITYYSYIQTLSSELVESLELQIKKLLGFETEFS